MYVYNLHLNDNNRYPVITTTNTPEECVRVAESRDGKLSWRYTFNPVTEAYTAYGERDGNALYIIANVFED